jgi:DNA segregation ATPase FtsK/SpoIIIE-like protein
MLQRKFSIGYTRAARIIDVMTQEGIVSDFNPAKPSRPRDVLITLEQWRGKQYAESRNTQTRLENVDVEQDAETAPNSRVERESAKVAQPVVVLPNGEERLASVRQYDDPELDYADGLTENQNNQSDGVLADNKDKDKGWSDEQWNQYINFDSELGK